MTSKELVKRAIEFKTPDRLPMEYSAFGVGDTVYFPWNQIGTGDHSKRETLDEWGCTWGRTEVNNMGQVTKNPLDDWSKLDYYRFPDPDDPVFWEGLEEKSRKIDTDKYIKTGIFMVLFERLYTLRGFQNIMMDFTLERAKLEALADRIVEFDIGIIRNTSKRFPGLIDGIHFTDDWGTQLGAFISVELFDEFFKPRYKRIFDACHDAGWHVWLHSCGKVTSVIPSLIDTGVNVFNLLQPRVFGIEEFGRQFAGRTCFSTSADIQCTLPLKSTYEIDEEIKLLLDCWAVPRGGFIVCDYGDPESMNISVDARKAMFDAFEKYDPYKKSNPAKPGIV